MKSKLYLGVALACSAAAAILPVHALAAEAEGAAAEQTKTTQEAAEATPVALNTFDVDGVVVTATRMPQAITDVPANVSVITAQEIEDNHYNTVAEALQNVNGVVINNHGTGDQDVVLLNGDSRVLVLVDGRRINSDQGTGTERGTADMRMIPSMKNIERIEVVKGGASALYGSDAVGGVVNVITKKGSKEMKTTLDAAYGSWHRGDYQITNEGSVKDLSWIITGSISHQDYFKTKDSNGIKHKVDKNDVHDKNFNLRLDYQMGKRESVTVGYTHINSEHGAYSFSSYPPSFDSYKRVKNSADITWKFKEGTKAPGFLRYYHENKNVMADSPFKYKADGVEYQNGWELGKDNILIAGIDYRTTRSTNEPNGYKNAEITNTAVYVQDTWNISKKWAITPGLRMDHHNKFGSKFSPKVAVNFTPDKKNQVYASWGRVFNAPQADDLFWNSNAYGWLTKGDPNLKPETGYTATIGWNHQFNQNAMVGISLFQSNLKDAIDWYTDSVNHTSEVRNLNREKKRGLEISYKQKIDKHWSFDTGMAFVNRKIDERGAGMHKDDKYSLPNSYRIGLNYRNRGWFVGVNTTIGSGRKATIFGNKHYTLLNLNASYQINETLKVYLKANNLTNQYYTIGSGSAHPGYGRFIQMGVQVSF